MSAMFVYLTPEGARAQWGQGDYRKEGWSKTYALASTILLERFYRTAFVISHKEAMTRSFQAWEIADGNPDRPGGADESSNENSPSASAAQTQQSSGSANPVGAGGFSTVGTSDSAWMLKHLSRLTLAEAITGLDLDKSKTAHYVAALLRGLAKGLGIDRAVDRLYIVYNVDNVNDGVLKAAVWHAVAATLRVEHVWLEHQTDDTPEAAVNRHGETTEPLGIQQHLHSITADTNVVWESQQRYQAFPLNTPKSPVNDAEQERADASFDVVADKTRSSMKIELPGDKWDRENEYLVEVHQAADSSYQIRATVGDRPVALAKGKSQGDPQMDLLLLNDRTYQLVLSEDHQQECALRRSIHRLVDGHVHLWDGKEMVTL